ncbi:MAG: nucleoside monophosphate kinase [Mycoplasmataceae bacterium]|jgi:adenylate kinase|nr:nucleoside monophosphate kinase [Mycoplasmataceae bacterium]
MKIVLLGAPGSGKGTLSNHLEKKYHFEHISTGDLFRKVIASGSELGEKLKLIVSTGALVSDQVTNAVMREELGKLVNDNASFILDGYPRTPEQAKFLEQIVQPDLILLIDVEKELAVKRIVGRRLCPKCGAIYNIYFKKPKIDNVCDYDGEFLIQRKDDNNATITKRFDLYEDVTHQLVDYYQGSGKLYRIDANNGIDAILPQIDELLNK